VALGYHTQFPLVPTAPPDTVSVSDVPGQRRPVFEAVIPVGAVGEVQARHIVPLQLPD